MRTAYDIKRDYRAAHDDKTKKALYHELVRTDLLQRLTAALTLFIIIGVVIGIIAAIIIGLSYLFTEWVLVVIAIIYLIYVIRQECKDYSKSVKDYLNGR